MGFSVLTVIVCCKNETAATFLDHPLN